MKKTTYKRPNLFYYRLVQLVCKVFSLVVFRCKIKRNEIKKAKGPFVVIANHGAAYDFVNLFGATRRRMTFVLSYSFYNSMPLQRFFDGIGVIPKQQFQTTLSDFRKMKSVVESGEPLVIYPAGLCPEDGIGTTIPEATYDFLKWLGVDVYVARATGSYFVMPKWSKGFHPGKTSIDIYKLMSKEELASTSNDELRTKILDSLDFDAYHDQEQEKVKFKKFPLHGLEKVLYRCPHCDKEFSISIKNDDTLMCNECGFEEKSDEYSLLHNIKGIGKEIRYVSDWARFIIDKTKEEIKNKEDYKLTAKTKIQMLDYQKHKFVDVGSGLLTLNKEKFNLSGTINEENINIDFPVHSFPNLPFNPTRYLELQEKKNIYRCVLDDSRYISKFLNSLKALYQLRNN